MSDYTILQELLDLARISTAADSAALVLAGQFHSIDLCSPANSTAPISVEGLTKAGTDFRSTPDGSQMVTYAPIVGPSADSGWVAVAHCGQHPDQATTLEVVQRIAVLVEDRLDRDAEKSRLDELSDQLRSNQERLHLTRDELSVTNQELEQFAYIAAHELVAPLRAVAVYAEVLESVTPVSDEELPSPARNCVNEIRAGVQHMTRQVQALLELSNNALDAGSVAPLDLNEVVHAALDVMTLSLDEIDAQVNVDQLPVVVGAPIPLQSVFANLFSNAVRYRSPDTQLTIQVTSVPVRNGFRIEVTDNGTGVAEVDRARIFQMFERASTDEIGSGIGLALSRKILNQFGASIGVEPGKTQGSVFWLEFPVVGAG